MSVGRLIEEELFSPISFDQVQPHNFTVSEKRRLTLDLSWCLLQLLNCKWTDQCWSVDDIFLLATSSEMPTSYLRGTSPYIVCRAMDTSFTDKNLQCPSSLGDSIFLRFGKLLVEIETGRKLIPTETNKLGDPSLWLTIDKIIEEGRMPSACEDYLQAVESCLQLHMQSLDQDTTINSEEWTQEIHDKIVANLEKDFGHYRRTSQKRRRDKSDEHQHQPLSVSPIPSIIDFSSDWKSKRKLQVGNSEDASLHAHHDQHEPNDQFQPSKRARSQKNSNSIRSPKPDAFKAQRGLGLANKTSVTECVSLSTAWPEASSTKRPPIPNAKTTPVLKGVVEFEIFDDVLEDSYDQK